MDAKTFESHFATSARPTWVVAAGILMDPHAADDVLQEVAVIAWGKRFEFQPGTSFTAWLCQIARNVSLRTRRDRRSVTSIETIQEPTHRDGSTAQPTPQEVAGASIELLERLGLSQSLARALQRLDETARACLLLRTLFDMDYTEISQLLNVPANTAMSHVHRARQRLLEQLDDVEKARR